MTLEQEIAAWVAEPRREPDSPFSALLETEYARRGIIFRRAHMCAPFDYLVNGLRVDAKGSRTGWRGTLQFNTLHNARSGIATSMCQRCDVVHCIGVVTDGTLRHYIIPARVIGSRTGIAINPDSESSQWFQWRDRWELLSGPGETSFIAD